MIRRGEIFLEGILLRVCAMICEMISFVSLLFLNSDFLPGQIQLRWHLVRVTFLCKGIQGLQHSFSQWNLIAKSYRFIEEQMF